MDRSPGVLVRIRSALSRDHVGLTGAGKTGIYVTVLEDNSSISKYEVYCAINITFSKELSEGMSV